MLCLWYTKYIINGTRSGLVYIIGLSKSVSVSVHICTLNELKSSPGG